MQRQDLRWASWNLLDANMWSQHAASQEYAYLYLCVSLSAGRWHNSICVQSLRPSNSKSTVSAHEAMTAVRRLKIERDALKAKAQELHPLVATNKQQAAELRQLEAVDAAISTIEALVGGKNPMLGPGMCKCIDWVS